MNNTFTILEGHFLDVAKQIADESVQVCVTSPPYYGLRSYGTPPQVWLPPSQFIGVETCDDLKVEHQWVSIKQYKDSWRRGDAASSYAQERGGKRTPEQLKEGRWTHTEYCTYCNAWRGELGQEPSPALYIDHLVQCFSEVWRILRPDGTLWVNIGDAHYNYRPGKHDDARAQGYNRLRDGSARDIPSFTPKRGYKIDGFKEKDLMLIPWRFAIAMQEAGWYIRSAIAWSKPNPLSESVEDRPTNSWEPVLLFSKSQDYYYDKWAVTEPPTGNAHPRFGKNGLGHKKKLSVESRNNDSFRAATVGTLSPGGRNRRTVWTINVQGYPEDHYAAYPEELPEICIKAGSSEVGCCRQCGAPWRRITLKAAKALHDKEPLEDRWRRAAVERGIDIDNAITGESITLGWERGCPCYAGAPVPCDVVDPFGGRGTTGTVAVRFGRNACVVDLKADYVKMIRKNLRGEHPLWVSEGQKS